MNRYRPLPILIVLLIVAVVVAVASVLADNIGVTMSAMQPVVAAVLVAAVGGSRILAG